MTPSSGESSRPQILQRDLDALISWSTKYLLKFNPQKCMIRYDTIDYINVRPKADESPA